MNGYDPAYPARGYLGFYDSGSPLGGLAGPGKIRVRFESKKDATPGFPGFFAWMASTHPDMFNYMRVTIPNYIGARSGLQSNASDLRGLGDVAPSFAADLPTSVPTFAFDMSPGAPPVVEPQSAGAVQQIIDTLKQAVPIYLQTQNQQQLLTVQLQRAKAGLPPLDLSKYTASGGINLGLTSGTQSMLMWVAGGLALVYLVPKLLKR